VTPEAEILRYTVRQNRDRDINELEGLIRGIALDGRIVPEETQCLDRWCSRERYWHHGSLFREARARVREAVVDGVLDDEERADILHFCERLRSPNPFYSVATADMQRLHGLLAGVGADGVVNEEELRGLREWIDEAEMLKGTWPYDEVDSLVTSVLADGRIDEEEHRFLVMFTQEFLDATNGLVLESPVRRRPGASRDLRDAARHHVQRESLLRHRELATRLSRRHRRRHRPTRRPGSCASCAGSRLSCRRCGAHALVGVLVLRA
jgi:hypothetical protein